MKKVKSDLHMHTRASDGTLTPKELIKEIKDNKIEFFSVTDHDSLGSVDEIRKLARENDVKFIPGVEVSSLLNGEHVHILAYNFDEDNVDLNYLIRNNDRLLSQKDDDSIKILIDDGFNLDFNEYLNYEHNPSRGGWKTLNFLIDKGICSDVDEFFNNVFVGHRELKYPEFPHPKKVIEIIKNAGGIPVLAHPRYKKTEANLEKKLDMFKEWGIEGVECSHPHHDEETIKYLKKYCKENDLIITGGSDYHGGLISKRALGKPEFYIEPNILDK